jgi:hypothetical protein
LLQTDTCDGQVYVQYTTRPSTPKTCTDWWGFIWCNSRIVDCH